MTEPGADPCAAYRWVGQQFTICPECGEQPWDHDLTHDGPAVPWTTELIGRWMLMGKIGRDRAVALLTAGPDMKGDSC